jgi:serpin B
MSHNASFLRVPPEVIALALATSFGGACGGHGASTEPSEQSLSVARSDVPRDTSPTVPGEQKAALIDGNTAFGVQAYRALGGAMAGKNVFFSPYSVSIALAMAYAGAAGSTATEMANALHYTLPPEQLHPAFDALALDLASRSSDVALLVATSLWGYTKENYRQTFLDTIASDYGAGVRLEDFAADPEGSRSEINAWVSDETDRKIANLLGPGAIEPRTRLVLVDAIYFRGDWQTPFNANLTQPASFARENADAVNVPTMRSSNLGVPFAQTDAYDAVELPYKGGQVAMDIVVPRSGSLGSFDDGLTVESLQAIVGGMKKAGTVALSLPKFTIHGNATSLKPMLQGFGMKLAFDPMRADFSGIADDPSGDLSIDDVVHEAYVQVDERGTEAAAATGAVITASAIQEPQAAIRVDRPFFFALRDLPTGTFLFVGRVMDPSVP